MRCIKVFPSEVFANAILKEPRKFLFWDKPLFKFRNRMQLPASQSVCKISLFVYQTSVFVSKTSAMAGKKDFLKFSNSDVIFFQSFIFDMIQ